MRIEQHLVRLAVVRHQAEGATGRQLGVCHFQAAAQPADEQVLAAPVELERLAQLEAQRHEPRTTRSVALLLLPALGKGVDRPSAAAVALRAQRLKHGLDPASIAFAAMAIGLEPLAQLLLVRIQDAGARHPLRVSGFGHLPVFEPLGGCVARDAQAPAGLAHRHVLPQHEAA